ncbi:MAG TPA: thioredoxin family protein [Acidimicrobiia bacterium]|nr:thioredoxin family protein [Acidimicrobiia bacterium]
MTRTPSTMLGLGTEAPDFRLPDVTAGGKEVALDDFAAAPALLVAFICNHCPFVQHVAGELAALSRELPAGGVAMVAVSSNDVAAYPADSPEAMAAEAARQGWAFPYLYDESQDVARAYRAACTPDFYLFDGADSHGARRLVYRGQLDASRPGNGLPVTGSDLRAAVDAVLAGRPVPEDQRPSLGCNIKWKPGNEPDYF